MQFGKFWTILFELLKWIEKVTRWYGWPAQILNVYAYTWIPLWNGFLNHNLMNECIFNEIVFPSKLPDSSHTHTHSKKVNKQRISHFASGPLYIAIWIYCICIEPNNNLLETYISVNHSFASNSWKWAFETIPIFKIKSV